ncbi:MAG: glycosyltransferase family 2 protein, partial [Candidatus Levyibacteriota bacterium]
MTKLSVVISAYNEERNIGPCLESVKNVVDEIIVVDNSSTDKTVAVAKKYTKNIFSQKNNPQTVDLQKNTGFEKATGEWILSLDADERVTPELASELKEVIHQSGVEIVGYWIPRKNIIFGKWIEHTGWYPDYR